MAPSSHLAVGRDPPFCEYAAANVDNSSIQSIYSHSIGGAALPMGCPQVKTVLGGTCTSTLAARHATERSQSMRHHRRGDIQRLIWRPLQSARPAPRGRGVL
jgi:hypothetical protein